MTAEGWANVRRNLEHWPADRLIEALCEERWSAVYDASGGSMAHATAASEALRSRLAIHYWHNAADVLVDAVMERIEHHNTCDNGGHAVWIDAEGYQTVPVARYCDRECCHYSGEPDCDRCNGSGAEPSGAFKDCRDCDGTGIAWAD